MPFCMVCAFRNSRAVPQGPPGGGISRTARRSVGTGADLSAERCGAGRLRCPSPSRPRPTLLSGGGIGSLAAASGDAATRASVPSSGALEPVLPDPQYLDLRFQRRARNAELRCRPRRPGHSTLGVAQGRLAERMDTWNIAPTRFSNRLLGMAAAVASLAFGRFLV